MTHSCSTCRQPLDWLGTCLWCAADDRRRQQDPAGWEARRIRLEAMGAFARSAARMPLRPDQAECDRINTALLTAYRQADDLDGGRSAHRLAAVMTEGA